MKDGRRRVTLARRAVRQIGEQLVALAAVPGEWERIESETAALVRSAKAAERSDELMLIAGSLERRRDEAEQWLRQAVEKAPKPVEIDPVGPENRPHTITTNLNDNLKDTVIAYEGSSSVGAASPPYPTPVRAQTAPLTAEKEFRLKVEHLLDLAPRLAAFILTSLPVWADIVNAAGQGLRIELGISLSLWAEACRIMGREQAAVALAIVSTKPAAHFTRGAGGYFAGMVRKAERGELRLERTLWALKSEKWGPKQPGGKGGSGAWKANGPAGAYDRRH